MTLNSTGTACRNQPHVRLCPADGVKQKEFDTTTAPAAYAWLDAWL
jgi:hypothetical protein